MIDRPPILNYLEKQDIGDAVEYAYKEMMGYRGFGWAYTDEDRNNIRFLKQDAIQEYQRDATAEYYEGKIKELLEEIEERALGSLHFHQQREWCFTPKSYSDFRAWLEQLKERWT